MRGRWWGRTLCWQQFQQQIPVILLQFRPTVRFEAKRNLPITIPTCKNLSLHECERKQIFLPGPKCRCFASMIRSLCFHPWSKCFLPGPKCRCFASMIRSLCFHPWSKCGRFMSNVSQRCNPARCFSTFKCSLFPFVVAAQRLAAVRVRVRW